MGKNYSLEKVKNLVCKSGMVVETIELFTRVVKHTYRGCGKWSEKVKFPTFQKLKLHNFQVVPLDQNLEEIIFWTTLGSTTAYLESWYFDTFSSMCLHFEIRACLPKIP